ncbi:MAG: UDP-phosphate galactose phosphotransferase [Pirellulaceae bacterium]|nr:MAG: UDP-phosphate galactose phosphotransferase [Pirellulaceae bacterium]
MKRLLDIVLAALLLITLLPLMLLIALLVKLTSPGPVLHWSRRVGRHNKLFWMPKFRTMHVGAPQVATHLLTDSHRWITPVGRWLRKTSLDELPQLWSILVGHMSFVGPRPALFNQDDLIRLRTACGIHDLVPGLTGWAQIHGRDELSIPEKVRLEQYYLDNISLWLDAYILAMTLLKVLKSEGVRQADDLPAKNTYQKAA